jgi:transaldolase
VAQKVPEILRNQLGIAIARDAYEMYRTLLDSPRWQRIQNAGARPQRLLWASTGTKDPNASNILYVQALALPSTINTMPEATLNALAAHPEFGEAPREKNDKFSLNLQLLVLTRRLLLPSYSGKASNRSPNHGTIFWIASRRRARRSRQ